MDEKILTRKFPKLRYTLYAITPIYTNTNVLLRIINHLANSVTLCRIFRRNCVHVCDNKNYLLTRTSLWLAIVSCLALCLSPFFSGDKGVLNFFFGLALCCLELRTLLLEGEGFGFFLGLMEKQTCLFIAFCLTLPSSPTLTVLPTGADRK